jgi:hypothetical protein
MRRLAVLLSVGLLGITAACGSDRGDSPAEIEPKVGTGAEVDWDNPLQGVAVPSVAAAREQVPFDVLEPKGLGRPINVFVSPPGTSPGARVVAFVYDTAEYGRVVVKEHISDVPPEKWRESLQLVVARNDDPGVSGRGDIVVIRGGQSALVTTSEDEVRSSIFFLVEEVEISVRGPTVAFDDVVSIAEGL